MNKPTAIKLGFACAGLCVAGIIAYVQFSKNSGPSTKQLKAMQEGRPTEELLAMRASMAHRLAEFEKRGTDDAPMVQKFRASLEELDELLRSRGVDPTAVVAVDPKATEGR